MLVILEIMYYEFFRVCEENPPTHLCRNFMKSCKFHLALFVDHFHIETQQYFPVSESQLFPYSIVSMFKNLNPLFLLLDFPWTDSGFASVWLLRVLSLTSVPHLSKSQDSLTLIYSFSCCTLSWLPIPKFNKYY